MPASTAALTIRMASSASAVADWARPRLLHPNPMVETTSPEWPTRRYCTLVPFNPHAIGAKICFLQRVGGKLHRLATVYRADVELECWFVGCGVPVFHRAKATPCQQGGEFDGKFFCVRRLYLCRLCALEFDFDGEVFLHHVVGVDVIIGRILFGKCCQQRVCLFGVGNVLHFCGAGFADFAIRSEEHTSELQSRGHLVCRLLLEKQSQKKEYVE